MKLLRYILFIFPFLFVSCGDKDETYADLFSIAIELDEQGGEVHIIKHECEVTVNGEQQYVHVTLSAQVGSPAPPMCPTSGHPTP